MTEERAYWLAWSQISGVGPISLQRLQQHFGTLASAWNAPVSALREVDGFGGKLLEGVREAKSKLSPAEFLTEHEQKNPHFWTPADADYPRLLLEVPSPPAVLYYSGSVNDSEMQGNLALIGIVGTRYPTEYGRRWTRKISSALARHGFTVVSGMAAGIDTEAHRGALDAGGRTLAIVGTGLDRVYPSSNRKLHAQIQEQGLVLSEYSAGTPPDKGNFPARNRIIAGLCRAILVMEAPMKSGALITARYANEFNRDVYVLPGSLDSEKSLGCLDWLNRGAQLILGEDHLLEALGTIPSLDTKNSSVQLSLFDSESPKITPELDPMLAQVYGAIVDDMTSFDTIVEQSGMTTSVVSGALLQLELMGLVSQLPGMRYQRQ